MKRIRTKFRNLSNEALKNRNNKMLLRFLELQASGEYGNMEIYQLLAEEFDISERNTVGAIVRKMIKSLSKK